MLDPVQKEDGKQRRVLRRPLIERLIWMFLEESHSLGHCVVRLLRRMVVRRGVTGEWKTEWRLRMTDLWKQLLE